MLVYATLQASMQSCFVWLFIGPRGAKLYLIRDQCKLHDDISDFYGQRKEVYWVLALVARKCKGLERASRVVKVSSVSLCVSADLSHV